ncbi:MAG: hypothetical protein M3Y05_15425 [Gemmatimonadota bacterium]|nr:hypothetical protein [Gemmatimonadota bacterium]
MTHIPYALLWTTIITSGSLQTGYYADMKSWFASRPQYALEKAFLHQVGTARDSAHRARVTIWGSKRWAINPYDGAAVTSIRLRNSEAAIFLKSSRM